MVTKKRSYVKALKKSIDVISLFGISRHDDQVDSSMSISIRYIQFSLALPPSGKLTFILDIREGHKVNNVLIYNYKV